MDGLLWRLGKKLSNIELYYITCLWEKNQATFKGSFYSESTIFFQIFKYIPNYYPELEIWMCCLLLLAGNLNFKFRIVIWNNFFWRFEKHSAHSEKKNFRVNYTFFSVSRTGGSVWAAEQKNQIFTTSCQIFKIIQMSF